MPVCIDTSVKLFVFLFVCGVSLSAGSLIDTMTDLQSSANPSTNASQQIPASRFNLEQSHVKSNRRKPSRRLHLTSHTKPILLLFMPQFSPGQIRKMLKNFMEQHLVQYQNLFFNIVIRSFF
jgi:hypothetical protein